MGVAPASLAAVSCAATVGTGFCSEAFTIAEVAWRLALSRGLLSTG